MNVFCALVVAALLALLCPILPVRPAIAVTLDTTALCPDPITVCRTS